MADSPLNLDKLTQTIVRSEEFLRNKNTLNDDRKSASLAARAIARTIETKRGENDLDSQALNVFSRVHGFYESQSWLDECRAKHGSHIPSHLKKEFKERKKDIRIFNNALGDLINTGGTRPDFSLDGMVEFLTKSHVKLGGGATQKKFYDMAHSTVIGVRNEMAVEQMLLIANIDYRRGTDEEDAKGGDFIVNGIAIDVKSSLRSAQNAQDRAVEYGEDPRRIIYSGIHLDDYEDRQGISRLTLPYSRAEAIAEEFIPAVCEAAGIPYDDPHAAYS